MSQITVESLNKIMDRVISAYIRALGNSTALYGIGASGDTYGTQSHLTAISAKILETDDADVISHLLASAQSQKTAFTAVNVAAAKLRAFVFALNRHFRLQGDSNYSNLETFLRQYNTEESSKWQVLQDYRWRDLYYAISSGSYPAIYNCYFEVLQGSTYANALRKYVGTGAGTGTQTAGQTIDSTKYCGGVPKLTVASLTGTGTVTVTGTAYDPATRTTSAGVTWTTSVTANGNYYLTPGTAPANSLIVGCSNISAAAGISAGTLYVEAERPPLRTGIVEATVSSTTVELDADASDIDDFYNGFEISTDADKHTRRTISDYNGTTKIATVSSAWATTPTAETSAFRIYRPQLPVTD